MDLLLSVKISKESLGDIARIGFAKSCAVGGVDSARLPARQIAALSRLACTRIELELMKGIQNSWIIGGAGVAPSMDQRFGRIPAKSVIVVSKPWQVLEKYENWPVSQR